MVRIPEEDFLGYDDKFASRGGEDCMASFGFDW